MSEPKLLSTNTVEALCDLLLCTGPNGMNRADQLRAHIAALEKERDGMRSEAIRAIKAMIELLGIIGASSDEPAADAARRMVAERDAALADNAALATMLNGSCHVCDGSGRACQGCLSRTDHDCMRTLVPCPGAIHAIAMAPHPGAALLEDHRKALVRARNEGLEKAAVRARVVAEHGCNPFAACTCNWESKLDGLEDDIRAMKEPESD